ncbi:peptidoglycan-binding protein [Candidatus Nomurabacteria bacterium]|nr:peptidoglycan-binding protein [Candidatus Nomurabacteria bacterium]
MENFKLFIFGVIALILVSALGYWAFFTIETGDVHVDKQRQKELEEQNRELSEKVEELEKELASIEALNEETEQIKEEQVETTPVETPTEHQALINDLQKLIDDKIVMKEKSRGTRVGTLQTFFNIYNNTTKRVDNDFGKTTKEDLVKFQKAVGLTADGEAGPTTYAKMIEWLKKQ